MKYALCTLIYTEQYIPYVKLIQQSLKAFGMKTELIVLVTSNLVGLAKNAGIENIKQIQAKSFDQADSNICKRYEGTLNKFHVYELCEYEYVFFIDADVFPYQNIDELLEIAYNNGVKANADYIGGRNGFFFGVKPSINFYNYVVQKYRGKPGTDEIVIEQELLKDKIVIPLPTLDGMMPVFHDSGEIKLIDYYVFALTDLSNPIKYGTIIKSYGNLKHDFLKLVGY